MSIKFNNVIPFPKKKVDVNLNDMWESILQKQKEIDELDAKMADIMEQAIEIEKRITTSIGSSRENSKW